MPYEVQPPKFAQVLRALQERIENGTYPPGSALPSESQLTAEFGMSRPTVVRALRILNQEGWVESQQGRGHFVRGSRAIAARRPPEHATDLLDRDESAAVELLRVGPVLASPRVAAALGVPTDTPVIARQHRTVTDAGPLDLVTLYFPVDVTAGTDLAQDAPIGGGIRRHLEIRRAAHLDYASERIAARRADAAEAAHLDIGEGEPVLTLLLSAFDLSGRAVLAADVVLPGGRHELEDSYPIT